MKKVLGILFLMIWGGTHMAAQGGLKIYISADMEGLVGVVTGEQLGPGGFEYSKFREIMTNEVNAAIAGARAAGATEILVSDSHGNGQNLLIDQLPSDIQLVRAWPRPLMMMEGIDDSFDGAIFIGYHSATTNPSGVRAHTISSARLTDVRLHGDSMSEAGINSAIAGHFGIPIIMVTGDDAVVQETKALLGDIESVTVKWAYGFHSARTIMPQAAYDQIREAAQRAVGGIGNYRPRRLPTPIPLEISFKNYRAAEVLSYLSIVERIDAHSIRFTGRDMIEVSRFLQFTGHYEPGISP